ncbi:hypothetical protein HanIR_Chr13g0629941 [Helianthus annuus]|nr:hypothetical protein HanIR_Chr13g0629941 [Helianthus annuus]
MWRKMTMSQPEPENSRRDERWRSQGRELRGVRGGIWRRCRSRAAVMDVWSICRVVIRPCRTP